MTPLEAARDWLARGFLPVPVPFREKAPVEAGWQKLRLRLEDLPRYFNSKPQNIGILLGDDSGPADIDCDCMEAVAAAAEFAPPTGICFGRKSKPASHYLYRSTPPTRSRKFVDPTDKSTIVELRGQKTNGTVGLQTVVPPSVHQCGEQIRFEAGADKEPGVADAAGLMRAVTRIAAAALLARHWPKEGSRHDAFLALAGILVRAGWRVEDASVLHRAIYRALRGGGSDFSACDLEVRSTFEKLTKAGEVTGFQTLASLIHGGVLQTALGWLGIAKHTTAAPVLQWPRIAPFLVRTATPLHAGLFSGFLGDMVADVSQATETPIELPGLLGLGIVAACVARKVTVSPEPGYEEPLNIYVAVGMESGNRKTAVLRAMAKPFVDWEFTEKERLQPERKRLLSERKTAEAQIEALRKKAAKSLADPGLVAQITELEAALPEVPALPRLWVQDVTPEQMAVIMAEQGERIALLSDEGGVFDLLSGLYSKGIPNLDLFLQAHSGSGVRVDRGSRPPVLMQQPLRVICASIAFMLDAPASHLSLWKKRLGRVPESVWEETELETLVLADNELSEVSEQIGRLKRLRMLDLGHNELTQIPDTLADLDGLTDFLYLHDNRLTSLPSSLGRLTKLRYLNISENCLEALPEAVFGMASLIELRASDNKLKSIPDSVGRLSRLRELHLRNNKLTSLPESIGTLQELRQIDLRGNPLTHLPAAIAALPRLEKLDLRWVTTLVPPAWVENLEARGCAVYR